MRWFWVRLNNYFNSRDGSSQREQKAIDINWTRADKPFNKMSKEEQVNFIHKMAATLFDNSRKD